MLQQAQRWAQLLHISDNFKYTTVYRVPTGTLFVGGSRVIAKLPMKSGSAWMVFPIPISSAKMPPLTSLSSCWHIHAKPGALMNPTAPIQKFVPVVPPKFLQNDGLSFRSHEVYFHNWVCPETSNLMLSCFGCIASFTLTWRSCQWKTATLSRCSESKTAQFQTGAFSLERQHGHCHVLQATTIFLLSQANLSTLQSTSKVTTKSVWNYSRTSCSRNTLRLTTSSPLNKKHSFGTGTSGKLLVSTPTEPLEYSAVALAPTRANYKWARLAFLLGNSMLWWSSFRLLKWPCHHLPRTILAFGWVQFQPSNSLQPSTTTTQARIQASHWS